MERARSVLADHLAGRAGDDGLVAAGNAMTISSWVQTAIVFVALAVFLTWLWRARVNSERMVRVKHRMSRGWTIGAWLCPIVFLWFPRRIVDDVWRASHPSVPADQHNIDDLPFSPPIRAWWFLIIANYLATILTQYTSSPDGSVRSFRIFVTPSLTQYPAPLAGTETLGYFETFAIYMTINTVLLTAAGILLIRVIRQITAWQSTPRVTPDKPISSWGR